MSIGKKMSRINVVCCFLMVTSMVTVAQENKSSGLKFNNLTVSPFVNLESDYDSNIYYSKKSVSDTVLKVNPGVDVTYKGNNWGLQGNGWFSYDKYLETGVLDALRYGDSLNFYTETANGWRLTLGQGYLKSSQNDSIIDGGRGLWRDREQLTLNGALSYKASEKTKVTLTDAYSDISYVNNAKLYTANLYGWTENALGLEVARQLTEKSNLLLNGAYQSFTSAGAVNGTSGDSTGYSLMSGFGSAATKKISYRVMVGYTWFDYADSQMVGDWTYSLNSSWVINKKWAATVSGTSYFQPSETGQNQASKVSALSAGLTYRPTRKLTTRVDIAGRREEDQFSSATRDSDTKDLVSFRTRADYELMRFVTLYASVDYQDETSKESALGFDRLFGSLGVNLKY